MAKKTLKFTEREIEKRYREGRGSGRLKTYLPWITVHDLSSLGLSSRIPSTKTGRIHHLLSTIETGAFLEFILDPDVVDVHEQVPLDREDTRAIALEMGVRHPTYPGGTVDVVMTTDLVVYVRDGGDVRRLARAIKPASDLDNARVLLKLEIERRYWALRGVEWMIITDHDQSRQRHNGLEWMHARVELDPMPDRDYWARRIDAFLTACRKASKKTFADVEQGLVLRGLLGQDEMIAIIRHLCAARRMLYDPERVFDVSWTVAELPIVEPAVEAKAA